MEWGLQFYSSLTVHQVDVCASAPLLSECGPADLPVLSSCPQEFLPPAVQGPFLAVVSEFLLHPWRNVIAPSAAADAAASQVCHPCQQDGTAVPTRADWSACHLERSASPGAGPGAAVPDTLNLAKFCGFASQHRQVCWCPMYLALVLKVPAPSRLAGRDGREGEGCSPGGGGSLARGAPRHAQGHLVSVWKRVEG